MVKMFLGTLRPPLVDPFHPGDNNTAEPVGVRGSTIETRTLTQLAQEAEEETELSVPPRPPGPYHSKQMETGIEGS